LGNRACGFLQILYKQEIFAHLASTSSETFPDHQIAGTVTVLRFSTETSQNHNTF
jgi:hypothetical protein